MRFLTYNIAYGTGCPAGEYRRIFYSHRYLATPATVYRRILNFIEAREPDVVGLIEADSGSRRTRGSNQVTQLADRLGAMHTGATKYAPDSWLSRLPYFRNQANALIGDGVAAEESGHLFFSCGTKKLIVTAQCGGIRFVLVHLALKKSVRRTQLEELAEMVSNNGPTVLAGDFNTFGGAEELAALLRLVGWRSANGAHLATYPAWEPRLELDYILYSPGLRLVNFWRPDVQFSDHLPLIADFELE